MRKINVIVFLTFLAVSCNSQSNSHYDKKATELNNRAVNMILDNPDSALILLDQATDIDSNYHVAYGNKVSVYLSQKDFENAIKSAEKGLIAKPDLAELATS